MQHELQKAINYSITAHRDHPRKPENSVRKWDNETPYFVHPLWCAMTLLTETSLPKKIRMDGYQALIYHDVLEDTTVGLLSNVSPRVAKLVRDMTYSSSEESMRKIWNKSKEVRLLKLYDSTSNLLDGVWIYGDKKKEKIEHVRKLVEDVRKNFGELNIVKIARTFTK